MKNSTYYLSLGENCLADDILKRYKLKSFSTPYSPTRSNIEYAIQNEKNHYANLLEENILTYEIRYKKKTAVNKKFDEPLNIYEKGVSNGFEFTHHDVISDKEARNSFIRKINRLLDIKESKIVFLYHYRHSKNNSIDKIIPKFKEFLDYYPNANLCVMHQTLCADNSERHIELRQCKKITLFEFYTLNIWAGENPEIFWARCDEDLIRMMIYCIKGIGES